MITLPADRAQRRRWAWALMLSLLVHLLLGISIVSLLKETLLPPHAKQHREEIVISSSSTRIEHRIAPAPKPQTYSKRPPQPQRQRSISQRTTQAPAPHELAALSPRAPAQPRPHPSPQSSTLARKLAQQEKAFARISEKLAAQNNPLAIATIAPRSMTLKRSFLDTSGKTNQDQVEAYLLPIRHWFSGRYSCYYLRYDAAFSSGGSERGVIPWPVCYPRSHDAIAIAKRISPDAPYPLPVPYPPAGYRVPKDTYLTPLLTKIYDTFLRQ